MRSSPCPPVRPLPPLPLARPSLANGFIETVWRRKARAGLYSLKPGQHRGGHPAPPPRPAAAEQRLSCIADSAPGMRPPPVPPRRCTVTATECRLCVGCGGANPKLDGAGASTTSTARTTAPEGGSRGDSATTTRLSHAGGAGGGGALRRGGLLASGLGLAGLATGLDVGSSGGFSEKGDGAEAYRSAH